MPDISQYKVGVCVEVNECGKTKSGKVLRACTVNVGDASNPVTIVTSASNVRAGSRVAVAPVGSTFVNGEGEEAAVTKTSVGGVMSEGMLCDSRMLGWVGGAEGVAVQVPESVEIGSTPPATKPRPKQAEDSLPPAEEVKGLFEKKLTKEEKKKIADEKRKAKKAAKEAKGKDAEAL